MQDEGVHDAALALARVALELLDASNETSAAVHIQTAIDIMTKAPVPRTTAEAEAMLNTPEVQALLERLAGRNRLSS